MSLATTADLVLAYITHGKTTESRKYKFGMIFVDQASKLYVPNSRELQTDVKLSSLHKTLNFTVATVES
jgi:hypothetical protein